MAAHSRFVVSAVTLVVLMTISAPALAVYRELSTPSLARSTTFSDATYQNVKAVLERPDCKFLGGAALNAFTSLRYAGDTIALNKFIEALSLCPGVEVHVLFFRPLSGDVANDWMVTHNAHSNQIEVRINLASEKVKLENLSLPPVKSEKAGE